MPMRQAETPYFVPQPSHWPVVGAVALLLMGMGAAFWFNHVAAGPWMVLAGFCVLVPLAVVITIFSLKLPVRRSASLLSGLHL